MRSIVYLHDWNLFTDNAFTCFHGVKLLRLDYSIELLPHPLRIILYDHIMRWLLSLNRRHYFSFLSIKIRQLKNGSKQKWTRKFNLQDVAEATEIFFFVFGTKQYVITSQVIWQSWCPCLLAINLWLFFSDRRMRVYDIY